MSRTYRPPEPLNEDHDVSSFSCRSSEQTDWLRRHAHQSANTGTTRAFVVTMRQSRTAAAVAAGQKPTQRAERVPTDLTTIGQPNDYGLIASLTPYADHKFNAVLKDIRPALRNAIAHLDPGNTMLVQDRWDDLQKVEQVLPALRWIARQLLDAELQHDDNATSTSTTTRLTHLRSPEGSGNGFSSAGDLHG